MKDTKFGLPHTDCEYIELQKPKSHLKATVYRRTLNEQCMVIKDYTDSHPLLRATICRALLRREIKALERIQGIPGVPVFLGTHGQYGFAMDWIEGQRLTNDAFQENPQLLNQLDECVRTLHRSGVTHNDIHVRNLIVDSAGALHIIDFASAITRSKLFVLQAKTIYKFFCFSDRVKVVRLKQQFSPDQLSEDDLRLTRYTKLFQSASRFWKKYLYSRLKSKR